MISISQLNITFNNETVLDQLDLLVSKGEIYGITGLNGSGKTAFLKVLATIMEPASGKVLISGYDAVKDRNNIRPLIGYMPDSESFENRLSIREYLDFFLSMYKKNRGDYPVSLNNLLDTMGLKQMSDIRMSDLSAGIKQKISFVRSLMHNPSVLLLDDPECGMDWEGLEAMTSILRDRSSRGTAIVISSRSVTFLNNIAHRIGVLHEGKLRWTFPAGIEDSTSILKRITALKRGSNESGTG